MNLALFLQLTAAYSAPVSLAVLLISWIEKRSFRQSIAVAAVPIVMMAYILWANTVKSFRFPGQTMNWSGQILMSVPFFIYAVWKGKTYLRRIGFMAAERKADYLEAVVGGTIIFIIGFFCIELMKPDHFLEKLLFELTLPGIFEEFLFRGVLLNVFNEHFGKRFKVLDTSLGWGFFLIGVPFAMAHVYKPNYGLQITWEAAGVAFYTYAASCILAWLRERSKSLFPAMLGHNVANTVELLFSRLRMI